MDCRLKERGRLGRVATASAACLAVSLAVAPSAISADLGGTCCADLEERIAELEATTSRKGNKKVLLTISRQNAPVLTFGKGSFVIDTGNAGFVTTVTPGTAFAVSGPRVAVLDTSSFTHEGHARRSVMNGTGQVIAGVLDGTLSCAAPADDAAAHVPQQCTKRGVWAAAIGGYSDLDATRSAFSGEQTLVGGLAGAHFDAAPGITAGFFGGYAETDLSTEFDAEHVETSFGIAGAFARVRNAQGFADLSVTALWNDSDRRRDILSNIGAAPGFQTATASADGWMISPALTLGLRVPVTGDTSFVPAVKVRGTFGQSGAFSETGSLSNFSAGARNIADIEARIELGAHKTFAAADGLAGLVRATAGLSYFGAFGDGTINGTLLGQAVSVSNGTPTSEFGGYVGLGLDVPLSASAALFADTELHLTDRAQEISGFGGVKVKF